jgi:hypothetical protein
VIVLGREPGVGRVVIPGGLMVAHRAPIISAATRNQQSTFARDGGLVSCGFDLVDTWRRAASYVDVFCVA